MSLLVWLPLDGNLNNYGILGNTFTASGVTVSNNGKIGKCYQFSGAGKIYNDNILINNSTMTAAVWAKFTSWGSGYPYLFSLAQGGSGASLQIGLWELADNLLFGVCGGGTEPSLNYNIVLNKWYHFCIVINGNTKLFYIDGELKNSFTISDLKIGKSLCLGARSNNANGAGTAATDYFNGYLNDFRLYDNALTAKEIKEIVKALIVHYPLAGYPNSNILNKPQTRLPAEYLEVEYILNDSSGNAYINLNYTPTTPFTSINMNGTIAISLLDNARNFICTVGSSSHSHYFEVNAAHKIGCYDIVSVDTVSNNERINFKSIITPNQITITAWGNKAYLNNSSSTAYASGDDIAPILLFRLADGYKGRNIKFFKYNLLENNILKFYLIPCYRISDNKPGMYDLINGIFYTNAGTGEFILGPLVSIPDEYMAVDYLSLKRGSYIDTGISVTNTHLFNFKYSVQSIVQWYGPFQAYTDENSVTTRIIANSTSTTNILVYFMSRAGSGGAPTVNNVYSGNNNIIEGYMNYNNTYLYNHTTQKAFNITNNHVAGTASTAHMLLSGRDSSAGRSKIYYFDTYNNGLLILALRPAIRISDRKPGMYDLVTGTFFVNQGSDEEFIYAINNIECDISGYNNHITPTNDIVNLLTKNDIPRYPLLNKFNSTLAQAYKKSDFIYNSNIWSMSVWLNQSAIPASGLQCILSLHRNAGADADKKMNISITTDKIYIKIEDKYLYVTPLITTNLWYHFVITSDGTSGKIYINNELKYTLTLSSTITGCNYISLGALCASEGTNKIPSNVSLSDFRFYATALSVDDIAELYNMGKVN